MPTRSRSARIEPDPLPPLVLPPDTPPPPIAPRPEKKEKPYTGRILTIPNPAGTNLPIIYGKARVGGSMIYRFTNDLRFVAIYAICHGPINSITNIKIDGKTPEELSLALDSQYWVRTGTASQTYPALLNAYEDQWVSNLPGIAHVIVIFKAPTERIPAVDVTQFQCDVEGMLVRDPRTDATLVNRYYRENPALCLADLLTSKRYGGGIADANVDWSGSVTDSANFCDVDIDASASVKKRFRLGLAIREAMPLEEAVDLIRAHGQLFVAYNSGKYQVIADQAQSVSGITFTDDNLLPGCSMRVKGSAEVPTEVIVKFINTNDEYKDGTAKTVHPDIAAGTKESLPKTYSLPGCPTYDQAKRTANWIYNRNALDKEFTLHTNADGARVLPGNVIEVTSTELNLSAQKILVTNTRPNGSGWTIWGEIYDASAYSDTIENETAVTTPLLPSPYDTPPDVIGIEGGIYWSLPEYRLDGPYGSSYWTATNLNLYDGTKVNDEDIAVKAFDWNVINASDLKFDAGAGVTKRIREIRVYTTAYAGDPIYEYSDDGSIWTAVTPTYSGSFATETTGVTCTVKQFADNGTHRYWRLRKSDTSAQNTSFNEVAFSEYNGPFPYIKEYRIYDVRDGARKLYDTVPAYKIPTNAQPFSVDRSSPRRGISTGPAATSRRCW